MDYFSFYVFGTFYYYAYALRLTVKILTCYGCYNKTMNIIQKNLARIDVYQRKHQPLAFTYAVVKKSGDDQMGYQAALVTYYGFLSLFPLLIILTTVASIVSSRDPALGQDIVNSVSDYVPVIGKTLEDSVSSSGKSGLALIAALLFSLYGARGVADAFRNAVNNIWHIPMDQRSQFPKSLLRSLALILGGGISLLAAAVISGWAADAGRGPLFVILPLLLNVGILFGAFLLIFRISLPLHISYNRFKLSAIICAVGLVILQIGGATILRNLTPSSYGALFATTLGLLAWIYLQARVIMYATVLNTVKDGKLWPRGLTDDKPTAADKKMKRRLER